MMANAALQHRRDTKFREDFRKAEDMHTKTLEKGKREHENLETAYWDDRTAALERGLWENIPKIEEREILGSLILHSPRGGWPEFDRDGNVISTSS